MSGDALRLAPGGSEPGGRVGHYELIEEIGRGGMGVVYRARDLNLGRLVALKRPVPRPDPDPQLLRRFLREAKATGRLSHPNIVPIFEVFEEGGVPWMAMELVEGASLRSLLTSGRPLPVKEVLRYSEGLASALLAAHGRHILHRDLKPSNVLIAADGRAQLTDFGLAQILRIDDASVTQSRDSDGEGGRTVMGTPRYMAPEQVLGKPQHSRTDIFALGAVLYEMCTGQPAFPGEDVTVLDAILHYEPAAITRLNYEVPAELERIVRKCLAKDPEQRYPDARDLLVDLRALRQSLDFATYAQEHARPRARAGRRLWLWAATAATAVAVGAGATVAWQRASRTPAAPASGRVRIGILMPQDAAGAPQTAGWPELVQALFVRELTGIEQLAIVDPFSLNGLVESASPAGGSSRRPELYAAVRTANLTYLIDGRITASKQGVRLQTNFVDPATGELQASHDTVVAGEERLPAAVGAASDQVLAFLQLRGLPVSADKDLRPWLTYRTPNIEALKAFLQATKSSLRNQRGGETHLLRALELDPNFVSPRVWLISALMRVARRAEAEEHYKVLQGIEPRASPFDQAMIGWAGAHIAGDYGSQARHLEAALQYSPDNNILLVTLGMVRYYLDDFQGALEAMATPLRMRWRYSHTYAIRGMCLMELGRLQEARKALLESLDISPVDPHVYAMLSALAFRGRQPEEGARYRELYRQRGVEWDVDGATQQAELGRYLVLAGVLDEGTTLLTGAVAANPDSPLFRFWLADALQRRGDVRQAADGYQRVLQMEPNSPKAHLMLARISDAAGHASDSRRHYEAFLAAAPSHAARAEALRRLEVLRGPKGT